MIRIIIFEEKHPAAVTKSFLSSPYKDLSVPKTFHQIGQKAGEEFLGSPKAVLTESAKFVLSKMLASLH